MARFQFFFGDRGGNENFRKTFGSSCTFHFCCGSFKRVVSPFSVSSLTCNFPPSQSQPVRSVTFLSNRPKRQQMNQLSFSSSLYILPSQSQLVVTSSLTLLSGRQQMNRQHHPGGRATSGGDRGPFFPLSFPSFESPKSPCNSPF